MKCERPHNVIRFPSAAGGSATKANASLPSPVDVFADWFKSLPPGVDIEVAAVLAIARIDERAPSHLDAQLLRAIFAAFAGSRYANTPVSGR